MAKKKNSGIGYVILFLLPVGAVVSLWEKSPVLAVVAAAGLLLVLGVIVRLLMPKRCDICGNVLKRASYTWQLDNQRKRVCPHCNNQLERQQSRAAMRQFQR